MSLVPKPDINHYRRKHRLSDFRLKQNEWALEFGFRNIALTTYEALTLLQVGMDHGNLITFTLSGSTIISKSRSDRDRLSDGITNLIKCNPNLQFIELEGHAWSTHGLQQVIAVCSDSTRLELLHLHCTTNSIDWDTIAPLLADMFRINRKIKRFNCRQQELYVTNHVDDIQYARWNYHHKLDVLRGLQESTRSVSYFSRRPWGFVFPDLPNGDDHIIARELGFQSRVHWDTRKMIKAMFTGWRQQQESIIEAFALLRGESGRDSTYHGLPIDLLQSITKMTLSDTDSDSD
jgi:hypothetical protein